MGMVANPVINAVPAAIPSDPDAVEAVMLVFVVPIRVYEQSATSQSFLFPVYVREKADL